MKFNILMQFQTVLLFIFIFHFSSYPAYSQETLLEILPVIQSGHLNDAVKMLERFIKQNPDSAGAYALLGKVYIAIGGPHNHTAAEKILFRAVNRFPEYIVSYELLARVKERQEMYDVAARWREKANEMQAGSSKQDYDMLIDFYSKSGYSDKIRGLVPEIAKTLADDPQTPGHYLNLGKALTYLAKPDSAIRVLKKGLSLAPENPAMKRALARAHLLNNQGDKFTETYFEWLRTENDGKVLAREFQIAQLAMPEKESLAFNSIPFNEKADYIRRYWGLHDPYPVSVQNERLFEHVWRTMYAEKAFSTNRGLLGFDDRGKVYIRWGEPEGRFSEPMPGMAGEFTVRANESWSYPSYSMYMNFDFVDTGNFYEEVQSLTTALVGGSHLHGFESMEDSGILFALKSLYEQRGHLGGMYHFMATEPSPRIFHMDANAAPTESRAMKHAEPPRFEFELSVKDLNFVHRCTQFRGDSARTRLDLDYAVHIEDLVKDRLPDTVKQYRFNTDFVLIDSSGERSLHTGGEQTFERPDPASGQKIYYLREDRHEAHSGDYTFSFQVLEAATGRGDFVTEPVKVRDFTGNALMISDIKYSPEMIIADTDGPSAQESVAMLPHPFPYADGNRPVYLYFEVYNLAASPSGARYKISINVSRERSAGEYIRLPGRLIGRLFSEGRPRDIETVYERTTEAGSSKEYLELDLSEIEPGKTQLTITVEDMLNRRTTSNVVQFTLE